jgi:hypothetical protein
MSKPTQTFLWDSQIARFLGQGDAFVRHAAARGTLPIAVIDGRLCAVRELLESFVAAAAMERCGGRGR